MTWTQFFFIFTRKKFMKTGRIKTLSCQPKQKKTSPTLEIRKHKLYKKIFACFALSICLHTRTISESAVVFWILWDISCTQIWIVWRRGTSLEKWRSANNLLQLTPQTVWIRKQHMQKSKQQKTLTQWFTSFMDPVFCFQSSKKRWNKSHGR